MSGNTLRFNEIQEFAKAAMDPQVSLVKQYLSPEDFSVIALHGQVIRMEDLLSEDAALHALTKQEESSENVIPFRKFADAASEPENSAPPPEEHEDISSIPDAVSTAPPSQELPVSPAPRKESKVAKSGSTSKLGLGIVVVLIGAGVAFLTQNGEAPKIVSVSRQPVQPPAPSSAELSQKAESGVPPSQTQSPDSVNRQLDEQNRQPDSTQSAETTYAEPTPAPKAPSDQRVSTEYLLQAAENNQWSAFQTGVSTLLAREKPPRGDRQKARRLYENGLQVRFENPRQALELARAANSADPADAEIADTLGLLMREAGIFRGSKDHLISVLSIWPDRSTAWVNLAETFSRLNENQNTVSALLAAYRVSKNPENVLRSYRKIAADVYADAYFRENVRTALKLLEGQR